MFTNQNKIQKTDEIIYDFICILGKDSPGSKNLQQFMIQLKVNCENHGLKYFIVGNG